MSRSDNAPDWRGWVALAWVVWFGLLYGKTVVEQRGGKLRGWFHAADTARTEPGRPR